MRDDGLSAICGSSRLSYADGLRSEIQYIAATSPYPNKIQGLNSGKGLMARTYCDPSPERTCDLPARSKHPNRRPKWSSDRTGPAVATPSHKQYGSLLALSNLISSIAFIASELGQAPFGRYPIARSMEFCEIRSVGFCQIGIKSIVTREQRLSITRS